MENVRRVVLFCDISGFMRLAGSIGERMPAFVQEFYRMVGDAVVSRGGRIVKYIGDAVLVVFPGGGEVEAVRCALWMRGTFRELLERYSPGEGARLEVAISSGEVVEGIFGHESLRLYDIMGETVAHAAILNRFPGIIVSAKVRDAVGGEFPLKELPPVLPKWGKDSLRAWSVLEE